MKFAKLQLVILICILFGSTTLLHATIINVPADHSTIQAAINASSPGDTILVQTGTYSGNINFNGKAITVGSLFLTTGDDSYISQTIIDAAGSGRCVKFNSNETNSSVLTGFKLINGSEYYGAGIYCYQGASPTISDLIITNCDGFTGDSYGGAIAIMSNSEPVCSNLTITNCSANEGGAIYFHDNGDATLSDCIFSGCTSAHGGALQISYSDPVIDHTLFHDNNSPFGGAVYVYNYSTPEFINCTFSDNQSDYGGAFYCHDLGGQPTITNCILWGDNSTYEIFATSSYYAPVVTYSDVEGGTGQSWFGTGCIDTDPLFVDEANDDYHLTGTSPCINTGDPSSPLDPDGSIADMGVYFYGSVLSAAFTVSDNSICTGETVLFTDNSQGNVTSWLWTFEGGTPASSTVQNPSVTYNTIGDFNVTLMVGNGIITNTHVETDYIHVTVLPGQPDTPTGPTVGCGNNAYEYTTNSVLQANSYEWVVEPAEAGGMTGNGTTGTFQAANDWTGTYTIKVRAENDCGDGIWSSGFQGTLYYNPEPFQIYGNGGYCEGEPGIEVTLDGSDIGVDYELYLDNVTTGIVVAGTGSGLSFGLQTNEGMYTVTGFTSSCEEEMDGSAWIYMDIPPEQAGIPQGPAVVCNSDDSDYTTTGSTNADTLIWTLEPPEAGVMIGSGLTVTISWDDNFSGNAMLSVHGENSCGDGPVSDDLDITVNVAPQPEISGPSLVCTNTSADYMTANNPDNSFSWEAVGGTIVSGQGTYQISVDWGVPGIGYVIVTEVNTINCTAITENYEVVVDPCTAIGKIDESAVKVYPNPAKDVVTISSNHMIRNIRLYDNLGKLVWIDNPGNELVNINVSGYHSGIYFVCVQTDTKITSIRLAIQ